MSEDFVGLRVGDWIQTQVPRSCADGSHQRCLQKHDGPSMHAKFMRRMLQFLWVGGKDKLGYCWGCGLVQIEGF